MTDLAAWRSRGGRGKSHKARATRHLAGEPLSTDDLRSYLSTAFKATLTKRMEPGVLSALSQAARTLAELAKAAELEGRLAEVERRLGRPAS